MLAVLHHGNIGTLYRPAGSLEQMSRPGESRPPFEDENVYYYGQYVALVIANTFEQAQDAAHHVRVEYDTSKPVVLMTELAAPTGALAASNHIGEISIPLSDRPRCKSIRPTSRLSRRTIRWRCTAPSRSWDGDKLTLYETSQGVVNHHNVASQVLDMPLEDIDVISRFIGSGFGDKLFPWPHSWMAAMAAKHVGRPVKFALSRRMMFTDVGHRPVCRQRMRLRRHARRKTDGHAQRHSAAHLHGGHVRGELRGRNVHAVQLPESHGRAARGGAERGHADSDAGAGTHAGAVSRSSPRWTR